MEGAAEIGNWEIEQGTDRRALHLAEILQLALHPTAEAAGEYPERACATSRYPRAPWAFIALAGAGLALVAGLLFSRRRAARVSKE